MVAAVLKVSRSSSSAAMARPYASCPRHVLVAMKTWEREGGRWWDSSRRWVTALGHVCTQTCTRARFGTHSEPAP